MSYIVRTTIIQRDDEKKVEFDAFYGHPLQKKAALRIIDRFSGEDFSTTLTKAEAASLAAVLMEFADSQELQ